VIGLTNNYVPLMLVCWLGYESVTVPFHYRCCRPLKYQMNTLDLACSERNTAFHAALLYRHAIWVENIASENQHLCSRIWDSHSGQQRHLVHWKSTDVSEEHIDSTSWVEEHVKQETSVKNVTNLYPRRLISSSL
jgi:hypothetical protein